MVTAQLCVYFIQWHRSKARSRQDRAKIRGWRRPCRMATPSLRRRDLETSSSLRWGSACGVTGPADRTRTSVLGAAPLYRSQGSAEPVEVAPARRPRAQVAADPVPGPSVKAPRPEDDV